MRVALLTGPKRIEIEERPVPQPGPGEVLVKVGAVGVCGSDVHYYAEGRIGSAKVVYPTVLGHEPSGVVEAVGEGVSLEPGTRIAVEPAYPCGRCEHCRDGRGNICPNVQFLATPPIEGIFAQYKLMPESSCIPIPDTMTLVEGALLEPLGVALHAVRLAHIEVGDSVGIFGSGPIGLVTLLAARAAGADRIFMTDLVPERLAFARQLGATAVMNPADGDVIEWIHDETNGRGVDVTFEAAGEQQTVTHACIAARIGGQALIIGIPAVDEISIPIHEVRRRELCIQNVRRSNREADRSLELVASGRIDLKPLATHFFPLDQVGKALDLVHNRADGVIRAIVQPNMDLAGA